MLSMFFKPKFYTKCKSCVKMTKTRLDTIRKKKKVVLKYLKKDIVELLKSRLDYNAYNRAEGFIVEQNVLRCYDLIDEFCGAILNQISVLNKQSECPEECKEAVASLIYAAARFADLPELRELRSLFTERYESSFGSLTNKELIEKLSASDQTKEVKLQLLQEIAQESDVDWNSKALEQQLYVPPQNEPDGERSTATERNKNKIVSVPVHDIKTNSPRKKDYSDNDSIFDSRSEDNTTETSMGDSSTDQDVHKGVSEDEVEDQKPFYLRFVRPPYHKTKPTKMEENVEEPRKVTDEKPNDESNKQHPKPVTEEKPKPKSVRRRHAKPLPARSVDIDDAGSSAANGAETISLSRNKGKEAMIGEEKGVGDDEERKLDGLLMQYSKKKTSDKGNLKSQKQQEKDNTEPQRPQNTKTKDVCGPARALSLPTPQTEPAEPLKRHARTNSFVHPKLPEYDQLAARIAALKEK